jgi:hypothetical protein
MQSANLMQWKPLKVITLGQRKAENINQIIRKKLRELT